MAVRDDGAVVIELQADQDAHSRAIALKASWDGAEVRKVMRGTCERADSRGKAIDWIGMPTAV
jgi:hypothetical protein